MSPFHSKGADGYGWTEDEIPRLAGEPITALVHTDLEARSAAGLASYGRPFTSHDGRDSLRDLYEEMLDAVQYLRKLIHERDGK